MSKIKKNHIILKILFLIVFIALMYAVVPVGLLWLTDELFYDNDYYLGANWNCEEYVFMNDYSNLYIEKIYALSDKYGLICTTQNEEKENNNKLIYNLYNEIYTIQLELTNDGAIGWYKANFYYYGNNGIWEDYEKIKPMVGFLNDFTNYVAYDTKSESNCFEELYYKALEVEGQYAGNYYHFDHLIGNVGYYVGLNHEGGYYYMLSQDTSIDKACYIFRFEGLLKPLINNLKTTSFKVKRIQHLTFKQNCRFFPTMIDAMRSSKEVSGWYNSAHGW